MTKQERIELQDAIDRAQAAIGEAARAVSDLVDECDDDDERDILQDLLNDLDIQLPAVGDYFPEDKKP